jgi:aminobenzoyl-glutamate utilization protein B
MDLKDKVISYIDKESSRLIEAADRIWELAEIAFDCPQSSQVLIDLLEDSGFSIEKNPADVPNSFVARFGHGKPVIGISAEYDALPDMAQTADSPVKDSVKRRQRSRLRPQCHRDRGRRSRPGAGSLFIRK